MRLKKKVREDVKLVIDKVKKTFFYSFRHLNLVLQQIMSRLILTNVHYKNLLLV